jgi:hypothetical protein
MANTQSDEKKTGAVSRGCAIARIQPSVAWSCRPREKRATLYEEETSMFNYRAMSDVELLSAYREILVAKRRQILWRAMENHNTAEKKIPNPGADHEKLAVLSTGSSCCTELHDIQIKIAALDAAVIEEEKRHQGVNRAA